MASQRKQLTLHFEGQDMSAMYDWYKRTAKEQFRTHEQQMISALYEKWLKEGKPEVKKEKEFEQEELPLTPSAEELEAEAAAQTPDENVHPII